MIWSKHHRRQREEFYGIYAPCEELDECNRLIEEYYNHEKYQECFEGHLVLAEKGYALAECQVGWFYFEGLGVKKDIEKAFYWTKRAAEHGDRDAQCNLGDMFYLEGLAVEKDVEEAKKWLLKAAAQENDYAIQRCEELGFKE